MSSNDATFGYWDRLTLGTQLLQGLANTRNECWLCLLWFHCIQQMHHEPVFFFLNKNRSSLTNVIDFRMITTFLSNERVTWLTAFCPRTVQRIPSEAFARTARIMYVGSMYLTSTAILSSLKYFFVYTKTHTTSINLPHNYTLYIRYINQSFSYKCD